MWNGIRTVWLPLLAAFIGGGCALSPQVIAIDPQLAATATGASSPAITLSLQVDDRRPSPVVGYRGGVYDTAAITVGADLTARVHAALAEALARRGFVVVARDAAARVKLSVTITALEYGTQQQQLTRLVDTAAAVLAVSVSGTTTRTGEYRDQRTLEVVKPPDAGQNEKLLNDVLAAALQRLVDDGELLTAGDVGAAH